MNACPVCGETVEVLDTLDFNKSCEEVNGRFLPASGKLIEYALCDRCGFCFAPEMMGWPLAEFAARIYNQEYYLVDPEYLEARPLRNAHWLVTIFGADSLRVRHLDYGGGTGELSATLFAAGWDSRSYDPFVDGALPLDMGTFNLVTSFEVFEHVPDVNALIATIGSLLDEEGVLLFTTLESDGQLARRQALSWWYAAPRNGHISLFSKRSLALLGEKAGFELKSLAPGLHMYWRKLPDWAAELDRMHS